MTQEQIERRREKMRLRMREKRKDPIFRAKAREMTKRWYKTEAGKAAKKRQDTKASRKKGHKEFSVELARKHAEKYLHNSSIREKVRNISLSKREKHPLARIWSLISPDGRIFMVRNLGSFIRENRSLFDTHTWGDRSCSSIYEALCQLSPRRKNVKNVIFGWRWYINGKHHETLLSVLPKVT